MGKSKKNLPIRIFEKRRIDTRETEGGGGKPPAWVLSGVELAEHAEHIYNEFLEATIIDDEDISISKDSLIPVSVKFKQKAFAKSHRGAIEKVFSDNNNEYASLGFSHKQEMVFALKSSSHKELVKSKIQNSNLNSKGISAIETISQYKPFVEKDIHLKEALKIKLLKFDDTDILNKIERQFKDLCNKYNILLKISNYSPSQRIYKASNVTTDSLDKIKQFRGVMSIASMPKYYTDYIDINATPTITLQEPEDLELYPTVGLLDSGVQSITQLAPWKMGEYSTYTEDELNKAHGTFVAGLLVYGDELISNYPSHFNKCKIFDAAVIGDGTVATTYEDELTDNIRETIENYGTDIKIWNLSLGSNNEACLHNFSDFAYFLDDLQQLHDILIVKSAGNCKNFQTGQSQSRITESGDSVLSVVVGSIAHIKNSTDIADVNTVSPFSCIGPGPQSIVKPDLVHYGGNSGFNSEGFILDSGVFSFGTDGQLTDSIGTSFSAPRVSALIANLDQKLDGSFNDLLLKTLTIHSSKYPDEVNDSIDDALLKYGFGLPASTDDIIYNDENEITLILQETLPKGQFIEILDFPFPPHLLNEDFYEGEITITLLNQPILDKTQGMEYIQSQVDVKFGTYDNETTRDTSKPTIKNEIGKENAQNLLTKTLYSKKPNKEILIEGGELYKAVKKYKVNLSELTPANKKNYLKKPKKWFLQLKGLYRHKLETEALLNNNDLEQKFCLAVTIRNTSQFQHPIYNYVTQELDNRQFIHKKIQLHQSIRVK